MANMFSGQEIKWNIFLGCFVFSLFIGAGVIRFCDYFFFQTFQSSRPTNLQADIVLKIKKLDRTKEWKEIKRLWGSKCYFNPAVGEYSVELRSWPKEESSLKSASRMFDELEKKGLLTSLEARAVQILTQKTVQWLNIMCRNVAYDLYSFESNGKIISYKDAEVLWEKGSMNRDDHNNFLRTRECFTNHCKHEKMYSPADMYKPESIEMLVSNLVH